MRDAPLKRANCRESPVGNKEEADVGRRKEVRCFQKNVAERSGVPVPEGNLYERVDELEL